MEPDASFVSNERWTKMPKPEPGEYLRVVPELVVEILSTSTASYDRGEEKGVCERSGVREYWLVDWRSRSLTVFRLADGKYDLGTVSPETDRATSAVLGGADFAVADLFPD